ncbi:protocadherin alpha-9-like, partial [Fukomys damarensis]|uniref:protocadherin alpha-9-like n=1 Tax=Fukomys damarensis TaxID=885580 RepID=UPI0014553548
MMYSGGSVPEGQHLLLSLLLFTLWGGVSGQLQYSVPEEAKHGTFVGRIAQDLELKLEDLVTRQFQLDSKGRGDLLEVNLQNGILFVNSRVDREELCGRSAECSIHLEVIVDRPLQVFHVEVEVKDINDNPPVFPATQKNLFIAESRPLDSRFPLEGASDADVGANALLTYRLSPNEYFSLDIPPRHEQVKPLGLVLRKPLDREEAPELYLLLTATDGGKPELTGSVQVIITVLDANDNAPVFHRTLYTVKLPEDVSIGTLVINANASDADEGVNGEITYAFSSDVSPDIKSKFHIDAVSGEITVIGLIDFEESKTYKIQVEAVDKGSLPQAGHCTVLVEVVDVNDNAPQLTVKTLWLPVKENAEIGTVIALISVIDLDEGANGQVTCSLMPDVPFKLMSTFKNYYSLVLDSALDRESASDYEVVVTARDGGSPSLWTTATVSVEVADVNDNAPVFAQAEYTVFVKENNPPGSGQAPKASSRTFVSVPGSEAAVVDVNVYLIIAICAVSSLLVLTLLLYTVLRCSAAPTESACGPGKPTLVCSSAVGSWSYSQQRGQRVCSGEGPPKTDLMAFSPSLPPCPESTGGEAEVPAVLDSSGKVTFLDSSQNHDGNIEVPLTPVLLTCNRTRNITACVRSSRSIHRLVKQEKAKMLVSRYSDPGSQRLLLSFLFLAVWETGSGQLHYSVPEEAKHGTFVGRIAQDLGIVDRPLQVFHVEVEVKDINDNPPRFSVTEQKISISESRLLDSRFPLEGASDADVGENAMLTYKLSSNDFFILDVINKKDKGKFPVLVLRRLLDREENTQFKLLLTATDGGRPEYTSSVSLLILVLDANDNAPVFDRSIYEVKMPENQANQTLVIWLNASDADEGINKEMVYSFSSLVPPTVRRKFLINQRTGKIQLRDAIDFEDRSIYEIHVDVTDKGNPPMVGHCTVLVEILDENDSSPEIVVTSLSLPVAEDAPVGTVIALISVSDRDTGVNGQVTCSLPPHVPFKLVSTFKNYYSLVLDSALDRESASDYEVVVTARDGGSPSLWATATVSVEVADVNDNAPVFAQAEYTVFVKENNPPGS